jgi:hypothetical protein
MRKMLKFATLREEGSDGTESTGAGAAAAAASATDWRSELPEAFREAPFIKAADSLDDAVSQLSNAASHMGNSIRVPSEEASEEDRKAFYDKVLQKAPDLMPKPTDENLDAFYNSMGRPEAHDKYSYTPPEGKEVPEDFGAFAEAAHKAGLSQDQFNAVLDGVLGNVWQQQDTMEHEQQQAMKALNSEWGLSFDQRMEAVKNFLDLSDAPDGIKELFQSEAMSPTEIKWLHEIATKNASAAELATQQTQGNVPLSPAEAQARIAEISANNDHPYWNAADPRHKQAVEKMLEYQKAAAPESTTSIDALRA